MSETRQLAKAPIPTFDAPATTNHDCWWAEGYNSAVAKANEVIADLESRLAAAEAALEREREERREYAVKLAIAANAASWRDSSNHNAIQQGLIGFAEDRKFGEPFADAFNKAWAARAAEKKGSEADND